MCGRFTLRTSTSLVAQLFDLVDLPELPPRDNISPTQTVAAVRVQPAGDAGDIAQARRELAFLRWGLVPSWAKDLSGASKLINARAETVASKPAFRSAFKQRRCLIVADGFYEWPTIDGVKQKVFIHRPDGLPFAFAGLWEHWDEPAPPVRETLFPELEPVERKSVESCTIITTEANARIAKIHDRMPVILPRERFDTWLDPQVQDLPLLQGLLQPCPADWLEYQLD